VIAQIEEQEYQHKKLGMYLIEAALITHYELDAALKKQQISGKKLGEILVVHGLLKQETIEYFMTNVVIPDRKRNLKGLSNKNTKKDENLSVTCEKVTPNNLEYTIATKKLHNLELPLSANQTLKFLLGVVISLAVASILANFSMYYIPDFSGTYLLRRIFDLNTEINIPTLYSIAALFFCSILLSIIAQAYKLARDSSFRSWRGMSIVFAGLAVDEYLSIHENLGKPLRTIFNMSGWPVYTWVIVGAIFVVVFLLVFGRFVLCLPVNIKKLFFIAGTIYVAGSLGVETIGGYYHHQYGAGSIFYVLLTTIEELLEMMGIVIFIYALLMYMSRYMKGMTVKFNIIDSRKQSRYY
jgi:hypothetical protein